MNSRHPILWSLAAAAVLLLGWAVLRSRQTGAPLPGSESSPPAATSTAAPDAPAIPPRLPTAGRQPDAPGVGGNVLPAAPAADVPAPDGLAELGRRYTELHAALAAEPDPVLGEVTTAFARRQLTEPAAIGAGWLVAQRWGVLLRAEQKTGQKEELSFEVKRLEELQAARCQILVEAPLNELKALLGGTLDPRLQAELEEIGRRHVATALKVPRAAGQGSVPARRRVTLPAEESEP